MAAAGDTKTTPVNPAAGSAAVNKAAPSEEMPPLEALEEDDDFAEFGEEEWDPSEMVEEDERLWQDDWDDDDIDDEFSHHLRRELDHVAGSATTTTTA